MSEKNSFQKKDTVKALNDTLKWAVKEAIKTKDRGLKELFTTK